MNDLIDQDAGACDGAADLEGRAEGRTQDVGRETERVHGVFRAADHLVQSGRAVAAGHVDGMIRQRGAHELQPLRPTATDWASPRWEACCRGLGEWRPPRRRVLPGKNAWRASFVRRSSFTWHKLLSRYRRRLRPKQPMRLSTRLAIARASRRAPADCRRRSAGLRYEQALCGC